MSHIAQLNHLLRLQPSTANRVLDLFADCGGLSLGFEAARFHIVGYEMDEQIAENPDHLIHFNGDKFLGQYKNI